MRSLVLTIVALGSLSVATPSTATPAADAAADPAPETGSRVEISNADGCPVRILERKSRVVDPQSLNARDERRGTGSGMYALKGWGAVERQIVFDVAFRNASGQDVLAVEFTWEALDADGLVIDRRTQSFNATAVPAGAVRMAHEVGLPVAGNVARYRVSVRGALLADGTLWTAPLSPPTPRPGSPGSR